MIHKNMPLNCTVFLFMLRTNTVCHFVESKFCLHKMADRVSWRRFKTEQFRGMFVWLNKFYLLNYLSNQNAFHNKWFHTLFKDQHTRSKAL